MTIRRFTMFLLGLIALTATAVSAQDSLVSVDDLTTRFKRHADVGDRAGLLNLYHWRGVDDGTRKKVEQEIDRLLNAELTSVEIKPVPEGMPVRFTRDGSPWRINLIPDRMVVVRIREDGHDSSLGIPVGQSALGAGYAIGVTIPDVPLPPPTPALTVEVVAGESVIAEIVCAYLIDANGPRKLVQYRGQGSFEKTIGKGASFESCAAKKRAGAGDLEIRLIEPAGEVYRENTARIDHALVYRRQ